MDDAKGILIAYLLFFAFVGGCTLYAYIDEKLHPEVYQAQRDEIAAREHQEKVKSVAVDLYMENLRQNHPELLKLLRFKESREVPEEFIDAATSHLAKSASD